MSVSVHHSQNDNTYTVHVRVHVLCVLHLFTHTVNYASVHLMAHLRLGGLHVLTPPPKVCLSVHFGIVEIYYFSLVLFTYVHK